MKKVTMYEMNVKNTITIIFLNTDSNIIKLKISIYSVSLKTPKYSGMLRLKYIKKSIMAIKMTVEIKPLFKSLENQHR